MSRECYQVTASPGSPIDDPYDALFNADATQNGEINFAPIAAEVKTIEWLYLAAKGHRRAYFDLTQTPVKMEWLVP
jgi:3-hydroxyisobutyrate dehydrogenase